MTFSLMMLIAVVCACACGIMASRATRTARYDHLVVSFGVFVAIWGVLFGAVSILLGFWMAISLNVFVLAPGVLGFIGGGVIGAILRGRGHR